MLFWTESSFHSETEASFSLPSPPLKTEDGNGGVNQEEGTVGEAFVLHIRCNDAKNTQCTCIIQGPEEAQLPRSPTAKMNVLHIIWMQI